MQRRLLTPALGLAGLTLAAMAQAQHEHHAAAGKAAPGGRAANAQAAQAAQAALAAASADCFAKGQTCLAHCLRLLGEGDTSVAQCAQTVSQLLPLCAALQGLAAQGSHLTPALAKVALQACNECVEACKPHVDHHAECKACHASCLECAKHCKALA